MKLKVPPVFQVLFFMLMMWGITKISTTKQLDFEMQKNISRVFFALGIFIIAIAMYAFRKARTTVDPTNPKRASKLVIAGIYKVTRNPMYLGMLLMLLGFAVRLGNLYTLPVVALYIWYITSYQIKPEEEALKKLFGQEYINYCIKVRRWI